MAEIGTDIIKAKRLLEANELVAIPTETVYGLAGNAFEGSAVSKIFEVKNRPSFDPLIAHTNSLEKVRGFVKEIPPAAEKLAKAFWPGPLTLLLPKNKLVPDLVTSGLDTLAVRIPNHSLTLSLLEKLDFPLAAPSANPFGYISPTRASHVEEQLGDKIPYILDGGSCHIGIESTIIGFEGRQTIIYRMGGKSVEEIEKIAGKVKIKPHSSSNPKAPGMLKSHYAPTKDVILGNIHQLLPKYNKEEVAILSFSDSFEEIPEERQIILSPKKDLSEAAQKLFWALRRLDKLNIRYILTELVPNKGLGRGINDRLQRASVK
ncbi:L-threonylcarbamoyladenylate synthase [Xanthovirga aplysinae]|uniref:L-threonylcarbamoyladenylate synthase n=1 Tax=Xanthovirga aplysinae TaxID=2529853 RepID=UPI0012BC05DC|nr:L-threonylcarbamoyladenylate synthase [Xanthovirga aplysinae]MTI33562.1 threonylcarbamoyl-AMP synthase [Xanthovirga aplysinae]